MERLKPLNDFIFKKLFGEKGDEPMLLSFLNAVLNRTQKEELTEIEIIENKELTKELIEDKKEDINIMNFDDENETYGTFVVYIVRQNETVNSILEKYNTTIEELEKYNDLKNINIGTKLIIPILKDKDNDK